MELQPVSRQMSLLPAVHDNDDLAAAPPLAPPESANFYVERPSIPVSYTHLTLPTTPYV